MSSTKFKLTVTPKGLDYGTVPVGQSVTKTFDISNTGTVPLTITKAKAPTGVFFTTNPIDMAFYFDALTFLFSALTIARLRGIPKRRTPTVNDPTKWKVIKQTTLRPITDLLDDSRKTKIALIVDAPVVITSSRMTTGAPGSSLGLSTH